MWPGVRSAHFVCFLLLATDRGWRFLVWVGSNAPAHNNRYFWLTRAYCRTCPLILMVLWCFFSLLFVLSGLMDYATARDRASKRSSIWTCVSGNSDPSNLTLCCTFIYPPHTVYRTRLNSLISASLQSLPGQTFLRYLFLTFSHPTLRS